MRNYPAQKWCVITVDAARSFVCIAVVSLSANSPQISALRVERSQVVDSDADTLRALSAVSESTAALRHARFVDILKRDNLSARFYSSLERTVDSLAHSTTGLATNGERRELALLCTSRCIFLAFLQSKGWLNNDQNFLLHHCTLQLQLGGNLHNKLLRPLFFGTLNTPRNKRAPSALMFGEIPFLNGGLFAPTKLEQQRRNVRFSDDALTSLIADLLDRYRFTAHEDSAIWSEAAIDPEMLGRSFESLMAREDRHKSGSFYTPPKLVDQVVTDALAYALPNNVPHDLFSLFSSPQGLAANASLVQKINELRILDPACGSGAFLVHVLERLSDVLKHAGDSRPVHAIRRDVLTRSIFGVDVNPIAVWLCELRLWLSVVIECHEVDWKRIPPLPNLDHNIRVGDTLTGGLVLHNNNNRLVTVLRERYARANGTRKRTLAKLLDNAERNCAIALLDKEISAAQLARADYIDTLRTPDLFGKRQRLTKSASVHLNSLRIAVRELQSSRARLTRGAALPFRFASHFAAAADKGFSLIIGNPPWVRPHALPSRERTLLKRDFVTLRNSAWVAGAKRAGAYTGFAAQADLAVAFVEKASQLLAPQGVMALLLPAKLWRSLAGGGVRRLLVDNTSLRVVRDWSNAPPLFNAAVYPSLIVAQQKPALLASQSTHTTLPSVNSVNIVASVAKGRRVTNFSISPQSISLANDSASPWLVLPPHVQRAFNSLSNCSTPLGSSRLGRPLLGVKCGCNEAFLVDATEHDDDMATIRTNDKSALIERILLRPVLRGESIGRTSARSENARIVWTHSNDGAPLKSLPPAASRWFAQWKSRLESRRDAQSKGAWYRLFRTEAARNSSPRIVWADIGRKMRVDVLHTGDPAIPLNSCYVMHTTSVEDALVLKAILTSPVAEAWLACVAEPARGGFHRYMGWTIATLPIPSNWSRARVKLALLSDRLASGTAIDDDEHSAVVADAYDVPFANLRPLLQWHAADSPEQP